MGANEYDLIVIGSGPAGQKGAICAAKMRRKVAIIDWKKTIGGVCVHTGTIPSKTLREAVLYLSGFRQRTFYGRGYVLKDRRSIPHRTYRTYPAVTNWQGFQ
jgi:NAD(P) transhydrogenase